MLASLKKLILGTDTGPSGVNAISARTSRPLPALAPRAVAALPGAAAVESPPTLPKRHDALDRTGVVATLQMAAAEESASERATPKRATPARKKVAKKVAKVDRIARAAAAAVERPAKRGASVNSSLRAAWTLPGTDGFPGLPTNDAVEHMKLEFNLGDAADDEMPVKLPPSLSLVS